MDFIRMTACTVLDELEAGRVSPLELLDALEARIRDVDGDVNALPTLCFERAREHGQRLMELPRDERGLLCGLPVPIKDLVEVAGVRTTHGSRIFADHVPEHSGYVVEQLEREGGLVYAKSNTPEFGAGANTFNDVHGTTHNPWDVTKSAAGSSGGAAAALATGMAWVAHGSDMGGSLRNPASFCGVVGLRPAPGRVAKGPGVNPYGTLSVEGPMARTIEDTALFLDAMTNWERRDPRSLAKPGRTFRSSAQSRSLPKKVAFSRDLGITPVEPEVGDLCERAAKRFEDLGVPVEEAHPDFSGAHDTFQTLRALEFAVSHGELLAAHRDKFKPELIWNVEKGLALTSEQIVVAMRTRGELVKRAAAFFDDYDVLLCPATIVAPYPLEQRYVESCNGEKFESYIDWLAVAYAITLMSHPALSLPCGFTQTGLPVGLQMVGCARGEGALLSAAAALEEALGLDHEPIDPRGRVG